MCIAHRLLLSTSEISDATASMPSPGYFALQHRVAPPRKAYSLTSLAFIAFGALYPFSLFKPVFRGSLKIKKGRTMTAARSPVQRIISRPCPFDPLPAEYRVTNAGSQVSPPTRTACPVTSILCHQKPMYSRRSPNQSATALKMLPPLSGVTSIRFSVFTSR